MLLLSEINEVLGYVLGVGYVRTSWASWGERVVWDMEDCGADIPNMHVTTVVKESWFMMGSQCVRVYLPASRWLTGYCSPPAAETVGVQKLWGHG
jgi:hypothetical protein